MSKLTSSLEHLLSSDFGWAAFIPSLDCLSLLSVATICSSTSEQDQINLALKHIWGLDRIPNSPRQFITHLADGGTHLTAGCFARFDGLQSQASLNGKIVRLIRLKKKKNRWIVKRFHKNNEKKVQVKPINLCAIIAPVLPLSAACSHSPATKAATKLLPQLCPIREVHTAVTFQNGSGMLGNTPGELYQLSGIAAMPNGECAVTSQGAINIMNARGQIVRSIVPSLLIEELCDMSQGLAYCQKTNSLFTYNCPDDGYTCFDASSGELNHHYMGTERCGIYGPECVAIADGRLYVLHSWEMSGDVPPYSCAIFDTATMQIIVEQLDGYNLAFQEEGISEDSIAVGGQHLAIVHLTGSRFDTRINMSIACKITGKEIHFWDLSWPENPKYGFSQKFKDILDIEFHNEKLYVLGSSSIGIYQLHKEETNWECLLQMNTDTTMSLNYLSVDQYYIYAASVIDHNVHTFAICNTSVPHTSGPARKLTNLAILLDKNLQEKKRRSDMEFMELLDQQRK